MDKIKTATGKEFDCSSFSTLPAMGMAYVRVENTNLATVASVFGNPEETVQLLYNNIIVTGYTKLTAIVPEGKIIRINLKEE